MKRNCKYCSIFKEEGVDSGCGMGASMLMKPNYCPNCGQKIELKIKSENNISKATIP